MKRRILDNPFEVYGYDTPERFCDRERETEDLIDAIENGRNVMLLSPRGICAPEG